MAAVFDANGIVHNVSGTAASPFQYTMASSLIVPSGATIAVVVEAGPSASAGTNLVTGITIGGVAMTKVWTNTGETTAGHNIWTLASPAAGTFSVVITRTNTTYNPGRFYAFTCSGTVTSIGTPNRVSAATGTGTMTLTDPLTSAVGRLVFGNMNSPTVMTSNVATAGFQTTIQAGGDSDGRIMCLGTAPGATTVTFSWDVVFTGSGRAYSMIVFDIAPSTVADTTMYYRQRTRAGVIGY